MRLSTFIFRAVLCGLAAVIFLSVTHRAPAAEIKITTIADKVNGDVSSPEALKANPGLDGISLREAILASNNATGPHTITFAPELAGQTIPLTSPLVVFRDGVTLTGLAGPDGQPSITLDGVSIMAGGCCHAILFAYASDFSLRRLRFVRAKVLAISIRAGQTLYPPTPPPEVRNIRIEDNIFDNAGVAGGIEGLLPDAIRIWTEPEGIAVNATIANVRIARNVFRGYLACGVIIGASGTNNVIRDIVIQDNRFTDIPFPVELGTTTGSTNRVVGSRVVGNTFRNAVNPLVLIHGELRNTVPPASGNVIDSSFFVGNTFSDTLGSVLIIGGQSNAVGNAILNTQISNNLITTGIGIQLVGGEIRGSGTSSPTGNRVDGVQIVNNTIITRPRAGLWVYSNTDGSTGNSVTGVTVTNTIFVGPSKKLFTGPEDDIAGEVLPGQVRFSRTSTPGFAGFNGNILANPQFVDSAKGDFHLRRGSPAIDAGTSDGAPLLDLEGRQRIDDPLTANTGSGTMPYNDIGAFEYGSPPAALLSLIKSGSGNGQLTSVPAGINGGADFLTAFNLGAMVRLTATPDAKSKFDGWSGDVTDSAISTTVTLDTSKYVVANFSINAIAFIKPAQISDIPKEYALRQNYPNPFNPSAAISYSLPRTVNVSLRIFNTLGQEVALLVNEQKAAGTYQIQWNAKVPSGIYIYRLQAGEFVESKKMIRLL